MTSQVRKQGSKEGHGIWTNIMVFISLGQYTFGFLLRHIPMPWGDRFGTISIPWVSLWSSDYVPKATSFVIFLAFKELRAVH